jgi:hypothetical protein
MNQMARNFGMNPSQFPQGPAFGNQLETGDVEVSGSQVGKGLGWLVMFLAVSVGGVTLFSGAVDATTRRRVEIAALVLCGFLLLYLGADSIRFVTFGFIVVLVGYVIEVLGAIRTTRRTATLTN